MPLMTVNGLDTIWAEAAIPQALAGGIAMGTPVVATVSAIPGASFEGKVEALLPTVDPGTRTQTARIVLDNPEHRLAPGMYAELRLQGAAAEPVPLIPDDAIISTGSDARVIVAEGDGRFRAVRIGLGRAAGGKTEVLSGLEGGERIVVSGQFLIDSEASLSGALLRLQPEAEQASGHDHGASEEPKQ
jgi:Cu(I)/Ag(I) efflux system membrane fusion protein